MAEAFADLTNRDNSQQIPARRAQHLTLAPAALHTWLSLCWTCYPDPARTSLRPSGGRKGRGPLRVSPWGQRRSSPGPRAENFITNQTSPIITLQMEGEAYVPVRKYSLPTWSVKWVHIHSAQPGTGSVPSVTQNRSQNRNRPGFDSGSGGQRAEETRQRSTSVGSSRLGQTRHYKAGTKLKSDSRTIWTCWEGESSIKTATGNIPTGFCQGRHESWRHLFSSTLPLFFCCGLLWLLASFLFGYLCCTYTSCGPAQMSELITYSDITIATENFMVLCLSNTPKSERVTSYRPSAVP